MLTCSDLAVSFHNLQFRSQAFAQRNDGGIILFVAVTFVIGQSFTTYMNLTVRSALSKDRLQFARCNLTSTCIEFSCFDGAMAC